MVVVGHLNDYIDTAGCYLAVAISNFIYTLHIPLFLFCSGLFISRAYKRNSWSGQIAASFGLGSGLWCVLFPVIGAIQLTAILAASGRPNEWAVKAKDWVSCRVLSPSKGALINSFRSLRYG